MAAIATQQIRKIYAIGRALGIVERGSAEDSLHDLVSSLTGKNSVKALTYAEAQTVIRDLEKRQGDAPPPRRKPKAYTERPGGATEGQQRKVLALMCELRRHDTVPSAASLEERLCVVEGRPGGPVTISRDHFNNEEDIPCLTLLTSLRLFLCFWQR